MLHKKLTIYKSWDLHQSAIPPCSRLYHLEPIGVGTPYVESLTGYIARLAEAHCVHVSTLISREVLPLVKEGYVFNIYQPSQLGAGAISSRILNGTRSTAGMVVQALEALTLRDDLRFLTMLPWTNVVISLGLLQSIRAWCPICYEEWRALGQIVYEPLIWALDVVTTCLHHSRHLQTQCHYCHRQLPLFGSRSRPGYCSRCQEWLGISSAAEVSDSEVLSEDELNWQSWVLSNIGELFVTAPCLTSAPLRERVTKNIVVCVNQLTGGNATEFGRLLELHHEQIRTCYVGKTIPQVSTILLICYRLGISLLDFLTKEVVAINLKRSLTRLQNPRKVKPKHSIKKFYNDRAEQVLQAAPQESPPPSLQEIARRLDRVLRKEKRILKLKNPLREFNIDRAEEALQAALQELPPPSLKAVATRLGRCRNTLRNNFPELSSAISARHNNYRKACAVEKIEQLRQQVRQVALELHAKEINPSSGTVAKLLTKPGLMRQKEAIAALQEVRRELGYEKGAMTREYNPQQ